jgi:hypothetical protein
MAFVTGLIVLLFAMACSNAQSPGVLYHNQLDSLDGILSSPGVTLDTSTSRGIAIRIESQAPRSVRLAEVRTLGAPTVVLTYRGHLRAEKQTGKAYLEMRCNMPQKGVLVSRITSGSKIAGTTDWVTQATRLSLGEQPGPQIVSLNVAVEGAGVVWVDNILLAQAGR